MIKETEINKTLEALGVDDVRREDDGDSASLGRLTKRINRLVPMARHKD